MANEFRKVTDQNGVDHPVTDDNRVTWAANAVLGAKNLLNNTVQTKTEGGVTFTVNEDKTITVDVPPANDSVQFGIPITLVGNYLFCGTPADGGTPTAPKHDIYFWDATTNSRFKKWDGTTNSESDYGTGKKQVKIESGHTVYMQIRVYAADSFTNLVFKPMITLPTDPECDYAHYVPPVMTNKELTDAIGRELSVSGLTFTNCEYVAGGYVVSGNICTINLRVKATANLGISISGLPYAKISNNSNYISAIMHKVGGAITDSIPAYCTSDGLLSAFQNAVNDANYLVSASYLVR